MDVKIENAFIKALENTFIEGVLSNSTDKGQISKVKIRPIKIKEMLNYQITSFVGKQVFHENMSKEELVNALPGWFNIEKTHLKQAELISKENIIHILISKKGKVTVKEKKRNQEDVECSIDLSHNRKKRYILEEGVPVPFLIDLGVMTKEGKIIKTKYDKFKQINRFLEFIEDILPCLPQDRELTILDFGCGKSYLTFAMYYYLKIMKEYDIKVIGLDLKKDVIEKCNELSKAYGYDKLCFLEGDIASYEGVTRVDMVVTLHACDTATDYALYKAVIWGAEVILSVPCCQHELNQKLDCRSLEPVLKYGLLKERTAALLTDGIRANLLELLGYQVQILEFIDMTHTPKNILIRGVKQKKTDRKQMEKKQKEYIKMKEFLGCELTLEKLVSERIEIQHNDNKNENSAE